MVNVDPAAWDRLRRQAKLDKNGLSEWEREQIGKPIRLEIPFDDPHIMAAAADMLRGLAADIEFAVQRDDIDLRHRLSIARRSAMMVNKRIRMMRGGRV